ncbi:hypothetical protein Dvina_50630 [Dactylosporangium vinaceum]|uniref:Secreted protein n=1 Tax=Dactylosporangium vinaceum TaxID=53362 RepID=A0ABV5M4L7_9ACTN|nr:hypothetical protein [Dactylosporangium vinaceum]UAB96121.1 hypothetical protein Dvina_50630 [Dactylosporangium vinaceum]
MGVLHGLLVAGVIGLIAVAPCLVCVLLMSADEVAAKVWGRVRWLLPRPVRRRLAARQRRLDEERLARDQRWARLDRWSRETQFGQRWEDPTIPAPRPSELEQQHESRTRIGRWLERRRVRQEIDDAMVEPQLQVVGPPIEQVAGDLRRLNRLRESVATRSRVWFVAVQEAYDEGLHVACAQLSVEEHLDELTGIDLEVERLRVEGELQRAGLVLRNAGAQQK